MRLRIPSALTVLMVSLCTALAAYSQTTKAAISLYLDTSQTVDKRVDDLVSRMTLEEKTSQLVNQARAIPRLQVPAYDWWSEALHGVARAGTATVFPEPIGLAATFDAPLIHDMAVVIGTEARAKHNQAVRAGHSDIMEGLDFWSPNINIFRDPRWGRGQETYGEDPFLTAKMGTAFVTGMQGDDPKYYRVNGEPACANTFLLQDQLRGAWKFNGYVVSDCDAVVDIFSGHHYTKNMAGAAAVALKTGVDNECADFFTKATGNSDYVKYLDAVKQGLITEKDIDTAVKRLFTARFRLGMVDPPRMG